MANKTWAEFVAELPSATIPLVGTEPAVVIQDGVPKKVNSSDVGGSSYLVAEVELDNDQIKALPTTAIILTPTPAIDKLFIPIVTYIKTNTANGIYGNVDNDAVIAIGPGSILGTVLDMISYIKLSGIITNTSPKFMVGGLIGNIQANAYEATEQYSSTISLAGLPLVAQVYNIGGDFTDGNAANTLKVTVYYVVVDL